MKSIVLILLIVSIAKAQSNNDLCAVTVRVVNTAGIDQPYSVTSFINEGPGVGAGVQYANRFQGLQGMVPCSPSLFTVEVDRTDPSERFGTLLGSLTKLSGRVAPWNSEAWLTLSTNPNLLLASNGVPIGSATVARPEGYVWKGRLTPAPSEPLWVHLRSAVPSSFVGSEIQAEIDGNGEFRVYNLFFSGPYILYVMNRQGKIVYIAPIESKSRLPRETLHIALPVEAPAPLVIR